MNVVTDNHLSAYPFLVKQGFWSWPFLLFFFYSSLPVRQVMAETSLNTTIVFPLLAPRMTSDFGTRKHPIFRRSKHHSGIDLAAPENSHVRAIAQGIVVFAGEHGGYGKLITIAHEDGFVSLYGHLNEMKVGVGKRVRAGDIIGRVGSTGWSTGDHLHFEWRKDGEALDPLEVFPYLAQEAEG